VLGKCCSAIAETSVSYQDCFGHKCKTQHGMSGGEENSLHPSQNQGRVAQPAATLKARESMFCKGRTPFQKPVLRNDAFTLFFFFFKLFGSLSHCLQPGFRFPTQTLKLQAVPMRH